MATQAFNTEIYKQRQLDAFYGRIPFDSPTVVEFGGKPFGDYHAARVLPGYDADVKADIIRGVHQELAARAVGGSVITMAVHAKDILVRPDGRRPAARIRGDYGITYDDEVLRMAEEARNRFDIAIANVAITSTPTTLSPVSRDFIDTYVQRLSGEFDTVRVLPEIQGYPYLSAERVVSELTQAEQIANTDQSELIVSPGGGSGKFSVAITELAHKIRQGLTPHYIKFETFPVFHLPVDHPLNVAFKAATVDLRNELVLLKNGQTNYDKDVGNFALLQSLVALFPDANLSLRSFKEPTDMGVNVIETGIIDEDMIHQACHEEVVRRVERYLREADRGEEDLDVATRANQLLEP